MGPADSATWLSIVPAAVAICAALLTRRVVYSLLTGVVLGAVIAAGGAPLLALGKLAGYLWLAATGFGHPWILGFALLLGGLVRVLNRSGGSLGLATQVTRFATTRRRGQLTAWGLGTAFFFDDYANTLLVGSSMGPVSDRLRISRQKLAFIVDATAAPIASLAPISTWIVVELGYIGDELARIGVDEDPYLIFLRTIPGRFYPLLMLALGLMVAWTGLDFGPMAAAEARALAGEADPPPDAADSPATAAGPAGPPGSGDSPASSDSPDSSGRPMLAFAPLLIVLAVVVAGIYLTGTSAAQEKGLPLSLRNVLANASSSKAMVVASLAGGLSALLLAARAGRFSWGSGLREWGQGGLQMLPVLAVLVLAWSLGSVCYELSTAQFLVGLLGDSFMPGLLPTLVFLVSALVSFGTGTSWGTMGILFPLAVPLADRLAPGDGALLLGTISSILAGSVFGDHCSPISDTTIMSALAAGCDQIAHVQTQLPYALLVAGVSVMCGLLPVGLGLWGASVALPLGCLSLYAGLRVLAAPPPQPHVQVPSE